MSADWQEWTINDLEDKELLLVQDGNHGEYRPRKEEFSNDGVAFIRAADLGSSVVKFETAEKINIVAFQRIRKGIGKDLDTILSTKGTVGKLAFVPLGSPKFVCSPQTTFWRSLDHNFIDPIFLYYELQSQHFFDQISSRKGETDMADYLSLTAQRSLTIRVPALAVQKEVAKVLTSVDHKIHLNTQTNRTLESIAQAIFKSWFVDFEPVKAKIAAKERWYAMQPTSESASPVCYANEATLPDLETYTNLAAMCAISGKNETELAQLQQQNPDHYQQLAETAALFPNTMVDSELGEIPEGWKAKNIESILGLAYGKSLGKTDRVDGDVPVYGSGGLTGWHNKSLVGGPGIIVGRKGTVGSIYWEKKNFFPIDTVFYVVPKDGIPLIYIYYLLQTLGLESMNTDAAVPGLNRNNVYRLDTVYSSTELIKAFSKLADSLRKTFDSLIEQSDQLIQIRDSLLPKLLSGEISLENYNESKLNHI